MTLHHGLHTLRVIIKLKLKVSLHRIPGRYETFELTLKFITIKKIWKKKLIILSPRKEPIESSRERPTERTNEVESNQERWHRGSVFPFAITASESILLPMCANRNFISKYLLYANG